MEVQNDEHKVDKIELTWDIAIKVWWWFTWRHILTSLLGACIIGFIIGFFLAIARVSHSSIQMLSYVIGFIFGLVVQIYFFRKVLEKRFKKFTIVLVKNEDDMKV